MHLQELVSRARILFLPAPTRFEIFNLINGKKSAKEIALKSGKSLSFILKELQKMKDLELIIVRFDKAKIVKKENSIVYEKNPLLKHLPISYFSNPTKTSVSRKDAKEKATNRRLTGISIPGENEILDICKLGEDQIYEFKSSGVDIKKISKEICAFANTKIGGVILYGVEDDGAIENSDKSKQMFDQILQNSVRNTISPALSIRIIEKDVMGYRILLILIPPWNTKDVYQYEGRVYLRQGTNVFVAKPEELKKLYRGEYVV